MRGKTPAVRVTEELKQWWTDRYTIEEIREMAAGLEHLEIPDHSRYATERSIGKLDEAAAA